MSKTTRDFAGLIRRRLATDAQLAAQIEIEHLNAHVATLIYEARQAAGLTQEQLASRVGTKQSVISRLEDADYDGHSLSMLKRIADSLNLTLRVEFSPKPPEMETVEVNG